MASAGIRPTKQGRHQVWWRLDDYSQGSKTFKTKEEAKAFKNRMVAEWETGAWIDPRRGKRLFGAQASEWWEVWSSHPRRSPKGLETTESHLRLHIRPYFDARPLRSITPTIVQRWQNQLEVTFGSHSGVMACRSILLRILDSAVRDRRIPSNPVRDVQAPKRVVNPEVVFGNVKPRVFSPEDFGRFLALCPAFYRDHFIVQVGTGLRSGELLGLQSSRVDLGRNRFEILDVRYDAGKFGSGYKPRPKSDASVRLVPLSTLVREAVDRRLMGCGRGELVFAGPGGSNWIRRGTRSKLSTGNLRRVYRAAVYQRIVERSPAGNKTVHQQPRFPHLELKGPHDLRHTFSTWLEDAGIPTRVIDEVMGHEGSRPGERGLSAMGSTYRHTTPAMLARIRDAVDDRLTLALKTAADTIMERQTGRQLTAVTEGAANRDARPSP